MSFHEYFYEYIHAKKMVFTLFCSNRCLCDLGDKMSYILHFFRLSKYMKKSISGLLLALFRPFKDEKIAEFALLTR